MKLIRYHWELKVYKMSVEAAMRIFTWTWFFHVFCRSQAWSDSAFQSRFLRTLFLHGEFTERYLERSDIKGVTQEVMKKHEIPSRESRN